MAGGSSTAFLYRPPPLKFRLISKALGATMWFFIFYRARQDGPKLLGLRHPWEGHDHDDHEAGAEHH